MKVVDILGQVLLKSEPNQTKAMINGTALAPGIYFVQVLINGKLTTLKMNVVR